VHGLEPRGVRLAKGREAPLLPREVGVVGVLLLLFSCLFFTEFGGIDESDVVALAGFVGVC
jgi:hypothetical protein